MTVYIASYDLRKPGRNYDALYRRLADWKALRVLESVWAIYTTSNAKTIRDDLKRYIDSGDGLLVAKLAGEAAWESLNGQSGPALKKMIEE